MKEGLRSSTVAQRVEVNYNRKNDYGAQFKNHSSRKNKDKYNSRQKNKEDAIAGEKKGSPMVLNDLESDEKLALSSLKGEVEEKGSACERVECSKDADVISDTDANVEGVTDTVGLKLAQVWRGRKRKPVESPENCNDDTEKVDEDEGDLVSNGLDSVEDLLIDTQQREVVEISESERVESRKDVNAVLDLSYDVDGGSDNHGDKLGEGSREGKRQKVESPKKGDDVTIAGDVEKQGSPLVSSNLGYVSNLVLSSSERELEEERSGFELVECGKDIGVDAGANTHGDIIPLVEMHKPGKGRRGRKRKVVDSSECNKDDKSEKTMAKDISLDGSTQAVGRVLRSRTRNTSGAEKAFDSGKGVGELTKKKIVRLYKKEVEIGKGESVELIGKPWKKLKGQRGRPPKVQGKNRAFLEIGEKKEKGVGSNKSSDISKFENIIRGSKFAHMHKKNRASEVIRNEKEKGTRFMENDDRPRHQGKGKKLISHSHHSGKSINGKQIKTNKQKKEGEMRRSEEKQLVREQIICMLKKAGWTIEYRPRLSKEYLDAVYVDPEGRTHWSVTFAYRKLKLRVDRGVADKKTISLFTPIPEEVLSKLFRVTQKQKEKGTQLKRQGEGGSKTKKGVTGKKLLKNKASTKSMGGLKVKENFNSTHKSSSRKMKKNTLQCAHQNSTEPSRKGKPRSTRKGRKGRKPCSLLVRSSEKGSDPDSDGLIPYNWKRNLLSWMIDMGTVPLSGKVQYKNSRKSKVLLEGQITRNGIQCDCCNEIMAISNFELHTGSKSFEPFKNLYLESGVPLQQCLLDAWCKQEDSTRMGFHFVDIDGDDPNDDTCNICGDGGDLVCCDGCPATFHQSCLGIQEFQSGDWHCLYCSCKFCETVTGQISQRDDNHDESVYELLTCRLCGGKFHQLCVQGRDAIDVNSKYPSFCGRNCQELFEGLQTHLGVKHELEEGFSWTLLQRCDVSHDNCLSGVPSKVESNSKLAVALSILNECFVPIVDERSGISMIQNVVYSCGSNFSRLNYGGFFTAVLEKGDEIISAASIRIHGIQLAEMPFIGTRHIYRRQGMCRRLLNAIESALCSLDIQKLVIPAISELLQTWTTVFGFQPLEEKKRKTMRGMSLVVFPGTDMLDKPLLKEQFAEGSVILASELGRQTTEDMNTCPNVPSGSGMGFPDVKTGEFCSKLDQHRICEVEGKPSIACQIGSDAMNCERKTVHALEEIKDSVDWNTEDNYPKHGCSSVDGASIQHSAEITTHHHDAELVPEFQVSDKKFVCQDIGDINLMSSDASYEVQHHSNSHGLVVHATSPSHGKTDVSNDSDGPPECSCEMNVIRTHEHQDVASVDSKQLTFSGASVVGESSSTCPIG